VQVQSATARLVFCVLAVAYFPLAVVAMAGAGAVQAWTNGRLRKMTCSHADLGVAADEAADAAIKGLVRRALPTAVYYCISSQVGIWILAFGGTTLSVAEFGALGRIGMAFNLVSALFSMLIVPRFARASRTYAEERQQFFRIMVSLMVITLVPLVLVCVFPEFVLAILGASYAGLTLEVRLIALSGFLSVLTGAVFSLSAAKGALLRPMSIIPLGVLLQLTFIVLVSPTTVTQVILLSILQHVLHGGAYLAFFASRTSESA
jgi:O-antigen/teichoic acid export membrane protein